MVDMIQTTPKDNEEQMIIFSVDDQKYCVSILNVREIREYESTTYLPHCPPYVEGAINIRGHIVTVVNMAKYLDVASEIKSERPIVIVVDDNDDSDVTCGLFVSSVVGITAINKSQIQPIDVDEGAPELVGLVTINHEIVRILKLKSVISDLRGLNKLKLETETKDDKKEDDKSVSV